MIFFDIMQNSPSTSATSVLPFSCVRVVGASVKMGSGAQATQCQKFVASERRGCPLACVKLMRRLLGMSWSGIAATGKWLYIHVCGYEWVTLCVPTWLK
eukprot:scaffold195153_cov19-Prasinocladus_malaysianus.AAC.1